MILAGELAAILSELARRAHKDGVNVAIAAAAPILLANQPFGGLPFEVVPSERDGLPMFRAFAPDEIIGVLREDEISPVEAMGGVSVQEFEEHVRQFNLPPGHPDKRD